MARSKKLNISLQQVSMTLNTLHKKEVPSDRQIRSELKAVTLMYELKLDKEFHDTPLRSHHKERGHRREQGKLVKRSQYSQRPAIMINR